MTNFTERYRQAWRGWLNLPMRSIVVLLLVIEWVLLIANASQPFLSSHHLLAMINWEMYWSLRNAALSVQSILALAVPVMLVRRVKRYAPRDRRPHLLAAVLIAVGIFLLFFCVPDAISLACTQIGLRHGRREPTIFYFFTPLQWEMLGDAGNLGMGLLMAILAGWLAASTALGLLVLFAPIVLYAYWGNDYYFSFSYVSLFGTRDTAFIGRLFILDVLALAALCARVAMMPAGRPLSKLAIQCRQVWQAWLCWPVFQIMAAIIVFIIISRSLPYVDENNMGLISDTPVWLGPIVVPLAIAWALLPALMVVVAPVIIMGRLRSQLTDWRSSLMPGFGRAHLLVAAVICATLFYGAVWTSRVDQIVRMALYCAQDQWDYREMMFFYEDLLWSAGHIAEILFIATLAGWVTAWKSPWLALVLVVVPAMLINSSDLGTILDAHALRGLRQAVSDIGIHPKLIAALWAIDVVLVAGLWLHLAKMAGRYEAEQRSQWAAMLGDLIGGFKAPHAGQLMNAGLWRRAAHRRLLGLGRRYCLLLAVYVAAAVSLSPLMGGGDRWLTDNGYALCTLLAASITSAVAVGLAWPSRLRPLIAVESLRPSGRNRFISEIGLAMVCDMAEVSVASVLAVFAPIAYWSPAAFGSPVFWAAAVAAILSQALVFGVIVWTMRFRSLSASLPALAAVIVAGAVLILQASVDSRLIGSLAAAAIGIALCADAYRRWIRVDIV